MHPHARLLTDFYSAFQRRDAETMAASYSAEATFEDAVFRLEGWRIGAMWRMLCERGKDLRLEFRDVLADGTTGRAHWDAWYTFSATGRPVHNRIDAEFTFQDGRILSHRDRFSFYRWAGQALGMPGRLFGWAPPMQNAIRAKASRGLDAFIRDRSLGPHGG